MDNIVIANVGIEGSSMMRTPTCLHDFAERVVDIADDGAVPPLGAELSLALHDADFGPFADDVDDVRRALTDLALKGHNEESSLI